MIILNLTTLVATHDLKNRPVFTFYRLVNTDLWNVLPFPRWSPNVMCSSLRSQSGSNQRKKSTSFIRWRACLNRTWWTFGGGSSRRWSCRTQPESRRRTFLGGDRRRDRHPDDQRLRSVDGGSARSVGLDLQWGTKETQFHGKAGKAAAKAAGPPMTPVGPHDDRKVRSELNLFGWPSSVHVVKFSDADACFHS